MRYSSPSPDAQPVDRALEQDGPNHRPAIETAHKGQVVGHQNRVLTELRAHPRPSSRFSNQQRRYRCGEKADVIDAMLLEDQVLGP